MSAEDDTKCGPSCCVLCGACRTCFEAGKIVDPFCWDDETRPPRQGKHRWSADIHNAARAYEVPARSKATQ